jgi:hypothetical protein
MWVTAIKVSMDKNILTKSSYSLMSSDISSSEYYEFSKMFKKQIEIYEAIAEADHNEHVTASGIDVLHPVEMMKYIESEMSSVGLGSQLVHLLQELIVVPVESPFAEEYWTVITKMCRDIRGMRRARGSTEIEVERSLLTTDMCKRLMDRKRESTGGKAVAEMNKLKLQLFTKVCH